MQIILNKVLYAKMIHSFQKCVNNSFLLNNKWIFDKIDIWTEGGRGRVDK